MDRQKINKVFEEVLKEYEKSEMHCILFYSSDKIRDFGLLIKKANHFRKMINEVLDDRPSSYTEEPSETRISC